MANSPNTVKPFQIQIFSNNISYSKEETICNVKSQLQPMILTLLPMLRKVTEE